MAIGNWGISGESQSYGSGYYPQIDYESGELFDGPLGPCDGNENFSIMLFGVNGNVNSIKNYGMCGCDDNLVCWFTGTTGSTRIASEGNKNTSAGTWNFKTRVVDDCASTLKRSSDACVSGECMFKYDNFDFSNYITTNSDCEGSVTGGTTWPQGINEYNGITAGTTSTTHTIRYCLHKNEYCFTNTINSCSDLICLYIPNTVKYINEGAFSGNSKLNLIYIPKNVVSIEKEAFAKNGGSLNCRVVDENNFANVNIYSTSCTTIKNDAFYMSFESLNWTSINISGCTNGNFTDMPGFVLSYRSDFTYDLYLPVQTQKLLVSNGSNKIQNLWIKSPNAKLVTDPSASNFTITTIHVPSGSEGNYQGGVNGWPASASVVPF